MTGAVFWYKCTYFSGVKCEFRQGTIMEEFCMAQARSEKFSPTARIR